MDYLWIIQLSNALNLIQIREKPIKLKSVIFNCLRMGSLIVERRDMVQIYHGGILVLTARFEVDHWSISLIDRLNKINL